jgi:hypothetical protein
MKRPPVADLRNASVRRIHLTISMDCSCRHQRKQRIHPPFFSGINEPKRVLSQPASSRLESHDTRKCRILLHIPVLGKLDGANDKTAAGINANMAAKNFRLNIFFKLLVEGKDSDTGMHSCKASGSAVKGGTRSDVWPPHRAVRPTPDSRYKADALFVSYSVKCNRDV